MDFHVHAGDEDSSFVFTSSDGYFSSHALRTGLLGGVTMHSLPPPKSDQEAIGREIMKKRIREEILAKEMSERRILEEEVRREIVMERIMELRRLKMESGLSGTSGMLMHGDRPTQTFMSSWPEARGGASVGREFVQDAVEFAFRERSSSRLLQNKPLNVVAQSSLQHKSEKLSPSKETTTSNFNLSGAKRKAPGEFLLAAEKQWCCALCEVNATSEKGLKEHLQGKRHRAVLSLEGTSASGPLIKKHSEGKNAQKLEGASSTAPPQKKHPEGKKQQKLWCSICKVKCNSPVVMEFHLAGKKHKTLIELKNANNSSQTEAVKRGSNERVGDTETEGFIKEEEVATAGI